MKIFKKKCKITIIWKTKWQQKLLPICLLLRHLRYRSNVIGQFCDHILQNKEMMGLYHWAPLKLLKDLPGTKSWSKKHTGFWRLLTLDWRHWSLFAMVVTTDQDSILNHIFGDARAVPVTSTENKWQKKRHEKFAEKKTQLTDG